MLVYGGFAAPFAILDPTLEVLVEGHNFVVEQVRS
jgi:hypothetical protein